MDCIDKSTMTPLSLDTNIGNSNDIIKVLVYRTEALKTAMEFVNPIIEKHGLSEQSVESKGTLIPTSNQIGYYPPSIDSKVDQHIDALLHVAGWLIGDSNP